MTEFSQGPALWQAIAALIIFAAAYVCILIEKWDRMYTALGGAALMLIIRHCSSRQGSYKLRELACSYYFSQAYLLFPAFFRKQELFLISASHILRKFRLQPLTLLLSFSLLAAIISALLDGLLAVVVIVPILLKTTKMMKLSPVPFLISMLLSVNIGGAATLMGNLPNRMIGAAENIISRGDVNKAVPLVLILLAIVYLVMWLIYRKEVDCSRSRINESCLRLQPASYLAADRGFLVGSCLITGLTLLALLLQGVLGWNAPLYCSLWGSGFIRIELQRTSPTCEKKRLSFRMARLERNTIAIFLWLIHHGWWLNLCRDFRVYCS